MTLVERPPSVGELSDSERLRPYVPRLVVDWLRHTPGDLYREVEGSLAFVDISGFTQLTERLARRGKGGAEEMSDALNMTFAHLLREAYDEGAGLVKWGGDAVLLLFDGPNHASHAARASHRMRATMREVGKLRTSAGQVNLRMSVGIHSGIFHFFLVGDPAHHRELLVSGPAASTTAVMEAVANAGEIALSAQTVALLDAYAVGTPVEGGALLRAIPRREPTGVRPASDVSDVTLAHVVPAGIREHLLAKPGDAEHRTIAVGFVQFSGTDAYLEAHGPAALADALDHVMRIVQHGTAAHGVTFFETDINRDGGKVMLTAGAPRGRGHEEDRMLRAGRYIIENAGDLPVRVGINRGPVFSGDFGPQFRRTYSVKGDAINLAARVMGKAAPGQVLATRAVVERAPTVFETEAMPPFMVKGKSMLIEAMVIGPVSDRRRDDHDQTPFVGRLDERRVLAEAFEEARVGRGGLVELVGDAGIGKSRLAHDLRSIAVASGARVVVAACEEYESSTPYAVVRRMLREVLDLPSRSDPASTTHRLSAWVDEHAPSLAPWLPLLGVALDAPIPDTPATAGLDAQFRKARLEEVTADLLAAALSGPTLLVVDDVHLMDDASADVWERIASSLEDRPWLVVVTRRPADVGWQVRSGGATTILNLAPLDHETSAGLVAVTTADQPLPPHDIEALVARAGGNPLFLIGLIGSARTQGADALPGSVEDLVTGQIDQLEPAQRSVLRHAAVLGLSFPEAHLQALLAGEDVWEGGDPVAALREFLRPDGDGRLRFQHTLLRDVAYEGLPYRRRRTLHGRAGDLLEFEDTLGGDHTELLSLHFFHAGRLDKAWSYSVTAGRRAAAKYAYVEASEFLRRAVLAARGVPGLPREELSSVFEDLGDAHRRVGVLPEARTAFRNARRESGQDLRRVTELLRKEALVEHDLDRIPQALRTLTRAMRLLDGVQDTWALGQRGNLEGSYAGCRHEQGRYAEAIRWGRAAEQHAEAAGDSRALAEAYEVLQMAHTLAGLPQDRPYGPLALEIFEALGDRSAQARALNNLAVLAWMEGRGRESLAMMERASVAFTAAGDTLHAAMADYNRGDVLLRQNRLVEAADVLNRLIPVFRALDSDGYWAPTLRGLGLAELRSGRVDEARVHLERARAAVSALGFAGEVLETDAAIVEADLAEGNWQAACDLVRECTTRAHALGAGYLLPTLHRLEAAAMAGLGDATGAKEELLTALSLCDEQAPTERGFVLRDLAALARAEGREVEAAAWEADSLVALDLLGYVEDANPGGS